MATLFGQDDSHYTAATDSDTQTHTRTHTVQTREATTHRDNIT